MNRHSNSYQPNVVVVQIDRLMIDRNSKMDSIPLDTVAHLSQKQCLHFHLGTNRDQRAASDRHLIGAIFVATP